MFLRERISCGEDVENFGCQPAVSEEGGEEMLVDVWNSREEAGDGRLCNKKFKDLARSVSAEGLLI